MSSTGVHRNAIGLDAMIDARFVFLGAILNLVGSVGYAVATVREQIQPNRITWLLWAVAPMIAFAAQLSGGIGITALMTFMVGFGPLLIFGSSFFNSQSYWRLSRLDWLCGFLSCCALIGWMLTREASVAIWMSILADVLAAVPTFLKSYRSPQTESSRAYICGLLSATITLLAVREWSVESVAFPMWIALLTATLLALINMPRSGVTTADRLRPSV